MRCDLGWKIKGLRARLFDKLRIYELEEDVSGVGIKEVQRKMSKMRPHKFHSTFQDSSIGKWLEPSWAKNSDPFY